MNKPTAFALAGLILLLLLPSVPAISSQEAVDFVSKQNNMLYVGETVEIFPNVKIGYKGDDFFVVAVLSQGSLAGFIPVEDSSPPTLPESLVSRRELLRTAYSLRYFQSLKESSLQQGLWLFNAKNTKFFSDLSDDLKNEIIDMTTISAGLEGHPILQGSADDLGGQLQDMYPLAEEVSDELSEAISFENDFIAGPDTNKLKQFQEKFNDAFDLIAELDLLLSTYTADLETLRNAIALADLTLETKQSLNRLANVPEKLQQFENVKADNSTVLDEQFNKIFLDAQSNLEGLVAGLETREKRGSAFKVLYAVDEEVLEETGQQSVSQLLSLLVHEDYVFRWNAQGKLADARANWAKAETFYNNGSFGLAEQFAERAKDDAIDVYNARLAEGDNALDTGLIFIAVTVLVIALIALYVLRNREKIAALVLRKEEEEELPAYGFEK